jgi:hypothetical protein
MKSRLISCEEDINYGETEASPNPLSWFPQAEGLSRWAFFLQYLFKRALGFLEAGEPGWL